MKKNVIAIVVSLILLVVGIISGMYITSMKYPQDLQSVMNTLEKDGFTNVNLCSESNCGYAKSEGLGFSAVYQGHETNGVIKVHLFEKPTYAME